MEGITIPDTVMDLTTKAEVSMASLWTNVLIFLVLWVMHFNLDVLVVEFFITIATTLNTFAYHWTMTQNIASATPIYLSYAVADRCTASFAFWMAVIDYPSAKHLPLHARQCLLMFVLIVHVHMYEGDFFPELSTFIAGAVLVLEIALSVLGYMEARVPLDRHLAGIAVLIGIAMVSYYLGTGNTYFVYHPVWHVSVWLAQAWFYWRMHDQLEKERSALRSSYRARFLAASGY